MAGLPVRGFYTTGASMWLTTPTRLGFRVKLHHKDLGIALDTARELDVTLPATALVAQIENGLIARGYGDDDVSAIGRAIREQSGID